MSGYCPEGCPDADACVVGRPCALHPDDGFRMIAPKRDSLGRVKVVVLDRIEPGVVPPYCCHGRTTCYADCGEWVWLGDATHDLVASGEAAGVCRQCASRLIPSGSPVADHVEDTRRGEAHP